MPGTHHIEARVFKDVFPRFRTMQGYHVARKAGWDCHGLPVELAVEKELGFSGKQDIEAYGVAEFNAKCRESVPRHVDAFEQMTERMGYWVDTRRRLPHDGPRLHRVRVVVAEADLRQGPAGPGPPGRAVLPPLRHRPVRPRARPGLRDRRRPVGLRPLPADLRPARRPGAPAGLDDHPLDAGVQHRGRRAPRRRPTSSPTDGEETLVVAEPLLETALGEGWDRRGERSPARELERWTYQRPFELVEFPAGSTPAHSVVLADYVTTEDGTGLVHQAPAFGADDLAVCRAYGLPVVNPVRPDGTSRTPSRWSAACSSRRPTRRWSPTSTSAACSSGTWPYEHSYPHCWRCHTPLLYYAQPSWYIRTTAIKDALLRENEKTNWFPETIKHGRYGDWLNNNIDWALSRNRYWGTPLPIWRCEEDHLTCVGSLAELSELTGTDQSELDPHRPYVDDVTFACPDCGEEARRVPEVIDAWYDSRLDAVRAVGLPARRGHRGGLRERATRRSSSARRSTRPAAGSTR